MKVVLIIAIACLFAMIGAMIIKMFLGHLVYDKMNGLAVINTDVIIILVLLGFYAERAEMFIDIAIAYGILGFISNIVVGKYLGAKEEDDDNS